MKKKINEEKIYHFKTDNIIEIHSVCTLSIPIYFTFQKTYSVYLSVVLENPKSMKFEISFSF